jgi:hypothetical protein
MKRQYVLLPLDLYNLNPLTANAKIDGINIIFCSKSKINTNNIPLANPIIVIIADIVYPKQKPLYNIIPNTIGIPITVVPKKP